MEDVITEAAPPSRLLEEDLNNFTSPSPILPSPFLIIPNSITTLKPTLLIIAISPSSLSLFNHYLNPKTLISSLILPELSLSLPNNTIDIHSLSSSSSSTLLVAVPFSVPSHRAHAVANLLIGNQIQPESVLILDSIQPMNYRGRLSSDQLLAFKLETSAEKKTEKKFFDGVKYYPSGSVVDGLCAAIIGRCQVLNLRGSLCVSWPQFDFAVVSLIKDLLQRGVLREFDFTLTDDDNEVFKFGKPVDHAFQSHLYI